MQLPAEVHEPREYLVRGYSLQSPTKTSLEIVILRSHTNTEGPSDIMHAADTLITPGSSTASPEQVQVDPAQKEEKEWSHPADMDGWVKVRLCLCAGAGWYYFPLRSSGEMLDLPLSGGSGT